MHWVRDEMSSTPPLRHSRQSLCTVPSPYQGLHGRRESLRCVSFKGHSLSAPCQTLLVRSHITVQRSIGGQQADAHTSTHPTQHCVSVGVQGSGGTFDTAGAAELHEAEYAAATNHDRPHREGPRVRDLLGGARRVAGDAKCLSLPGDTKSSLGDAESSLGDAKSLSLLGDTKSSLGDAKS